MFSLNNCSLRMSRTLSYLYDGVHLLCFAAVAVSVIPLSFKVLSTVFLLSIFLGFRRQIVLQTLPVSITAITWNAEVASMRLQLVNGSDLTVVRIKQKVVLPFVVCLLCDVEERFYAQPVVVFSDACSEGDFRRLRVLSLHASTQMSS